LKYLKPKKILLIGASTGGPSLIKKIVLSLEKLEDVSVVIAQHMAEGFVESFAKELNKISKNDVVVVLNGLRFEAGKIYFCKDNSQVVQNNGFLEFTCKKHKGHFNPDIDAIFSSFEPFTKTFKLMCIILTGMGDDGIQGCLKINKDHTKTITQSAKDAIVDGMPLNARERIDGIKVALYDDILTDIKGFCNG
jgi:two-component system chemotaxis response regulator CheB